MNDLLNAIAAIHFEAESGRSDLRALKVQRLDLDAIRDVLPTLARRGALDRIQEEAVKAALDKARRGVDAATERSRNVVCALIAQHAPGLGLVPVDSSEQADTLIMEALHDVRAEVQQAMRRTGSETCNLTLDVDDHVTTFDGFDAGMAYDSGPVRLLIGDRSWPMDDVIAVAPLDDDRPGVFIMTKDETIVRILPPEETTA